MTTQTTLSDWLPNIEARRGPTYLAIAQALAEDIRSGNLSPGTRMPTHRELAYQLGVTVGTVSRSYAEATRLGLIDGEVGRGTFVRRRPSRDMGEIARDPAGPNGVNLGLNYPPMSQAETDAFSETLAAMAGDRSLGQLLEYTAHCGSARHRHAGARWLKTLGVPGDPERTVVTSGAQNGMLITFTALTEPGETVLVDKLTFPGMVALANLLNLRLTPVEFDEHGPLPEALERAAVETGARAYYTMPTIHNPTNVVIPLHRRREIAEIAKRRDLVIVEDDIYRFLAPDAPETLASLAPDNTIFVASAAKQLAPGLRIGAIDTPQRHLPRIEAAMRTSTWMATPAMAEVLARWVEDGTAEHLGEIKRAEMIERQRIAKRALTGFDYHTHPASMHVWLRLPEAWRGRDPVAAAAHRGVTISAGEVFAAGAGAGRRHIRISVGNPKDRHSLERGLSVVAATLTELPFADPAIV